MLENYSGATRLIPIVGDPIAQVRAPFGMTTAFTARGRDMICVPMQVSPTDFPAYLAVMRCMKNVDGLIVTIPHKVTAASLTPHLSDRARFLGSVNTLRRRPDGEFEGDMLDGLGFVEACRGKGCDFREKRALLVGVGGAGAGIAHAVVEAGVAHLTLSDVDVARCADVATRLRGRGFRVSTGTNDPRGHDIVLNATPLGMREADPLPVVVDHLTPQMFVGDVVTKPEISPLIAAARALGAKTSTGGDMFLKVRDLMVDYLLAEVA